MTTRRNVLLLSLVLLLVLACNLPGPPAPVEPEPTSAPATPSTPLPPPPTLEPPPDGPPAPTALNVPLHVRSASSSTPSTAGPVTSGVPLPRALAIADPDSLRLVDAAGSPVPAQFTPLARWGAGPADPAAPIRWLLVDFQAAPDAYYYLQEGGPGPAPAQPLIVADSPDTLTIDTGSTRFTISRADGRLAGPGLDGPILGRAVSGASYETGGPVDVRVALEGPMRVSVHVRGAYRDAAGSPLLDYTARYWFYAGQPTVRLFYTVENNHLCALGEYAQPACHDIGSEGSVAIEDLSLVIPTGLGGELTYRAGGEGEPAAGSLSGSLVLYQDSSGTDHWDHYPTLTDWDGNALDTRPRMQSYVSFRGYRTTLGEESVDSGNHAAGWLSVTGDGGAWTVAVEDFWHNFPKALRAHPAGTLEVGLFPAEFGPSDYAFTLRAGEHKTHELTLTYGDAPPPTLVAAPPARWLVESGALGRTALPEWTGWPAHEQYLAYLLDAAPDHAGWNDYFASLPDAIRSTDFYGMFDYGDWPIDYEGYEVGTLNVKYDNNLGLWLQWARSGDPRWFELARALNRHAADVDILHNEHTPRHWGDGIAFGHSYHDEEGFVNPHRNYGGMHPDTAFGTAGLLLTYYLTGYEKAHESALELADCIEFRLRNDDHLCDAFPECSGEGYGLMDGMYDSGSRPAANTLFIAVSAYRATGDPRYLEVADAVVEWADPAAQPYIDGPTGEELLMKPWLLNMYLRALADYIDVRQEFGLPDTYGAQADYLAYADWLRTTAWLDLEPAGGGARAAYPYEWWLDGRQGDPSDEWATGNNIPSINNWLLLGADGMAYAYHLSGEADYLERAERLFRTGSEDPWFEGDPNLYAESKEALNSVSYGHTFLHIWAEER